MFKRLANKIGSSAASKDMDGYLSYLQVGTNFEMAMTLVGTGFARQILLRNTVSSTPFPEQYFRGLATVNDAIVAALSQYNLEIMKLRKTLMASDDDRQQLTASGVLVFIQSFRALSYPELFPKGRLIWKELLRGADEYMGCLLTIRPDLTEENAEAFCPLPNVLAPEDMLD